MKEHNVIVLGAGSYGTTIACLFSKELSVGLYGRLNIIKTYRDKGITLHGTTQERFTENERLHFYSTPEELKQAKLIDNGVIILATKTPDLETIVEESFPFLYNGNRKQNVLMIQNGIAPELRILDLLKERYPKMADHLVGGVVMGRMNIEDFDNPWVSYNIGKTSIGAWSDYDKNKEKKAAVAGCVSLFGYIDDIGDIEWATSESMYQKGRMLKAMLNGANSVATLVNAQTGMLIDNFFLRYLMREKLIETITIANSEGFSFNEEETRKTAYNIYDTLVRPHKPSMCHDLELALKRPEKTMNTEIIDLDLDFVQRGNALGLRTRMNSLTGYIIEEWSKIVNDFKANGEHGEAVNFSNDFINLNREKLHLESREWHPSIVEIPLQIYENFQYVRQQHKIKETHDSKDEWYAHPGQHEKKEITVVFVDDKVENAELAKKQAELFSRKDSEFSKYYILTGHTADGGKKVLEMVEQGLGFDVLFSDIVMPDLDGASLVKALEKVNGTEFVMYTAHADQADKQTLRRVGVQETLLKPYSMEDMWDAVKISIYNHETKLFKNGVI